MMTTFTTTWEDEENNRIVELAVQCQLKGESIEIVAITPHAVTFVDGQTRAPVRTVRVHTETGRQVLCRALHARGGLERVQQEAQDVEWAEAL